MNNIFNQVYSWLSYADPDKTYKPSFETMKKWLDSEAKEFKLGQDANNKSEMLNGVIDQIWIVCNMAYYGDLTIEDLESEANKVYNSNMTKYAKTESEAVLSVSLYDQGTHPNKIGKQYKTYYNQVKDLYIIRNKEDNKILKSYKFKDCNEI